MIAHRHSHSYMPEAPILCHQRRPDSTHSKHHSSSQHQQHTNSHLGVLQYCHHPVLSHSHLRSCCKSPWPRITELHPALRDQPRSPKTLLSCISNVYIFNLRLASIVLHSLWLIVAENRLNSPAGHSATLGECASTGVGSQSPAQYPTGCCVLFRSASSASA